MWQTLVAALLVLACSAYAAWSLMPAAWRARLRPGQPAASGCGGCSGCGPAAGPSTGTPPAKTQPIRFVRRPPAA